MTVTTPSKLDPASDEKFALVEKSLQAMKAAFTTLRDNIHVFPAECAELADHFHNLPHTILYAEPSELEADLKRCQQALRTFRSKEQNHFKQLESQHAQAEA